MRRDRVFVNKSGLFQILLNNAVLPHTWAIREYAETALAEELRRERAQFDKLVRNTDALHNPTL